MNLCKRLYKRIFEEIYYFSPYPIRSKIALLIYSRKGYEWAKLNDLDLSKDSYPPKRGSEKIYDHDFNDVINNKIFVKEFNANEWRCDEVITDVQHLEKPTLERDTTQNIMSAEHIDETAVC